MKLNSRHRQQHRRMELSMTSMIDVVFLLLIFFLVTTTFVRPERQLLSAIQSNEREAAKKETLLEPAMVDVRKTGDKVVYRIGAISTDNVAEVKRVLQGFENKTEGAWVRVADDVPFEFAARAIGACRAAGFSAVAWLPAE